MYNYRVHKAYTIIVQILSVQFWYIYEAYNYSAITKSTIIITTQIMEPTITVQLWRLQLQPKYWAYNYGAQIKEPTITVQLWSL